MRSCQLQPTFCCLPDQNVLAHLPVIGSIINVMRSTWASAGALSQSSISQCSVTEPMIMKLFVPLLRWIRHRGKKRCSLWHPRSTKGCRPTIPCWSQGKAALVSIWTAFLGLLRIDLQRVLTFRAVTHFYFAFWVWVFGNWRISYFMAAVDAHSWIPCICTLSSHVDTILWVNLVSCLDLNVISQSHIVVSYELLYSWP